MNVRMRHDYVLVKQVQVKVGDLVMPDSSIQGKEFIVQEIGPEVKDLEVGDKVLMRGTWGADYYEHPNHRDIIVIQEKYVVLVYLPT